MLRTQEKAAPISRQSISVVVEKAKPQNRWKHSANRLKTQTVRWQTLPLLDRDKREERHAIYDQITFDLQNTSVEFKDKELPYILHDQTTAALKREGLSDRQIQDLHRDIIQDPEYMPDVRVLVSVPSSLHREVKNIGGDPLEIVKHSIVPIPGELTNMFICEALQKRFSIRELGLCNIFTTSTINRDGIEFNSMRIDVEPWLSKQGFFLPVRNSDGQIYALKVFRYPKDKRPFLLRSRGSIMGLEEAN